MSEALDRLIEIRTDADVGAARRHVRVVTTGWDIDEQASERACIVATELGTNIVRHGGGEGYIVVRLTGDPGQPGLDLVAVDRGPGLSEMARARHGMPDGARSRAGSTTTGAGGGDRGPGPGPGPGAGGLGVGLGGVGRLADVVDIDTARGAGTVVLARFQFGGTPRPGWLRWSGMSVPLVPHDGNGDAWAVSADERYATVLVVDGLGHGRYAKEAADAALAAFDRYDGDSPAWIGRAHEAMRATRGGVLALARIDRSRRALQFVGVGNISGRVVGPDRVRGLASTPGTVGTMLSAPRARPVEEPWSPGSTLVLWSDGIRSGVDLTSRPRLLEHDPAVVAAAVHRDFHRDNDDATVVVLQEPAG